MSNFTKQAIAQMSKSLKGYTDMPTIIDAAVTVIKTGSASNNDTVNQLAKAIEMKANANRLSALTL